MKKAKTQTGLIKSNPDAKARARKTTTKKRKQGGKGRPFQSHGWATYAPGNKAPQQYKEDELKTIVTKAAKAANQRLRTLEKEGLAKDAPAYKYAAKQLEKERPRFKERTAKMTRQELNKEFLKLREFMIKKTSTVTGYREAVEKKLQRARDMGFTGTPEELSFLFDKYMTEKNEQLYGSEVIYQAITSNQIDNLQDIAQQFQAQVDEDRRQGAMILEMLRRKRRK